MKKFITILCVLLLFDISYAQIKINNSIGSYPGDSISIQNISNATDSTNLVSVKYLRENIPQYYTPIYTGDTIPLEIADSITGFKNGLLFIVKASTNNKGDVKIFSNGNYYSILKNDKTQLKKGEIINNKLLVMIYNNSNFYYLNPEKESCPDGFKQVNESYCIEINERQGNFWTAGTTCQSMNARLCSWSEWYYACQQSASLGIVNMTNNWEWIKWAKNEPYQAAGVGSPNCTRTVQRNMTNLDYYRCCFGQ